jgi:AcrR family transcriptional regulator
MTDARECSGASCIPGADEATTRIEQIADAALRRFARYGFKRSSMDDIASEAGLAKATLYLHFKGKDDVFRAMIRRFGTRVEARCREVVAQPGSLAQRLDALMQAHFASGYVAFGAGEHLAELKAVMAQIASREIAEVEGVFVTLAMRLLAEAGSSDEITLERVAPEVIVATLLRAAVGAKVGTQPSPEVYAERLSAAAAVAAAAVAKA